MDRSWIEKGRDPMYRASDEYIAGVTGFIEFAISKVPKGNKFLCPCIKCSNTKLRTREQVFDHLVVDGMLRNYKSWNFHGEAKFSTPPTNEHIVDEEEEDLYNVNMPAIINDVFAGHVFEGVGESSATSAPRQGVGVEEESFTRLKSYASTELYPGCKEFSKLSFTIALYQIKCLCKWSDKSYSLLLDLLTKALPHNNTLPKTLYETKKIIGDIRLNYNNIHACPNDCMLYWKEASKLESCIKCGTSRYKSNNKSPAKVLRHFPLIPRLQRLYMSSVTSYQMRWHHDSRRDDGNMRHPVDGEAWKDFDRRHPTFSEDPRNVRLGLSSDGFNPFKTASIKHSTWPVIVVPYNLPPWMCMKESSFILTLLIPGPKQPGNDIDVYLQPLIEELKLLWDVGVDTYDSNLKESFSLRACLLWTINDFPAYANLSGWSTKGAFACPICNEDNESTWLKHGRKHCYQGHRRFLDQNHGFRRDKIWFNGQEEVREAPPYLTGADVIAQLEDVQFPAFGKVPTELTNVTGRNKLPLNWKKKSIFFELTYWKDNLLRHNLDVMHIEKNVCDSIYQTLLELKDKTKDSLKARQDLVEMNIRPSLHPRRVQGSSKVVLPPACHTMSKEEKKLFCKALKDLKVPWGYAGNISRCVDVKERSISRLKSHDCHVLMQQLLPLALRVHPMNNVKLVLLSVSSFFRGLCTKVGTTDDFKELEQSIVETLCQLERIFPPAFFDVMVHLLVHLPREAYLGGPVHYRWMYPFERFNKTLKGYTRNLSQPEGSIAEGYVEDECLTFCSRHFEGVETKFTRPSRNFDGGDVQMENGSIFSCMGRTLGGPLMVVYYSLHKEEIKRTSSFRWRSHDRDKEHAAKFPDWFRIHVNKLRQSGEVIPDIIKWLALGLMWESKKYSGYICNGIRYHTEDREVKLKSQSSGVLVTAITSRYASRRDDRPRQENICYYGVLKEVVELEYYGNLRAVLFRCKWADTQRGVVKEDLGFTRVNFDHLQHSGNDVLDDPFVLPNQTEQVFYVSDPLNQGWQIAVRTILRDHYDMNGDVTEEHNQVVHRLTLQSLAMGQGNDGDDVNMTTNDLEGAQLDLI